MRTVLCFALLACVCACTKRPDIQSAHSVSDQIGKALTAKDTDGLKASFADDAVLLQAKGPAISGLDAIVSRYAAAFKEIDYNISLVSKEMLPAGEYVVDRGSFEGTLKSRDGRASAPVAGKYLNILKLQPGNRWKLWQGAWEFDPPTSTAATACGEGPGQTGTRSCCCKDIGGNDCRAYGTGCGGDGYGTPVLLP